MATCRVYTVICGALETGLTISTSMITYSSERVAQVSSKYIRLKTTPVIITSIVTTSTIGTYLILSNPGLLLSHVLLASTYQVVLTLTQVLLAPLKLLTIILRPHVIHHAMNIPLCTCMNVSYKMVGKDS